MRRVRSEMLSLLPARALPVAVFCSLPYSALRRTPHPLPSQGVVARPFAAFVSLTPDEEAQVMRRAKSTGSGEPTDAAIRPDDLVLRELPDDPPTPLVRLSDRTRPPELRRMDWRPPPYLPTCAAPPPAVIPTEQDEAPPFGFSKEELLKLDD